MAQSPRGAQESDAARLDPAQCARTAPFITHPEYRRNPIAVIDRRAPKLVDKRALIRMVRVRFGPRRGLSCPCQCPRPPSTTHSRPPRPGATTEIRKTTCYMCACRCGIRVHLRDGEVRYIDGNPDHPLNQGVICAKGSSGIMKQYSPARLTKPLVRKPGTERGAGEFVEITWDEAFAMLEERLREDPRHRPEAVRAVHRPRPDAGADRPLRAPVRHAQLCGARRLLLGQHGRRHDLHDRRLVLGVRRPRPRAGEALRDDRHRRGPSFEPAEDRDLEVQARRRTLHLDQPDPHRLLGDRRRLAADQARHRRRAAAGADPRAHRPRPLRPRVPGPLHECRPAREHERGERRVRHVRPHRSAEGRRLLRPAEQAVVGPRDQPPRRHAQPRAPTRSCWASSGSPTAPRSSPRSSC